MHHPDRYNFALYLFSIFFWCFLMVIPWIIVILYPEYGCICWLWQYKYGQSCPTHGAKLAFSRLNQKVKTSSPVSTTWHFCGAKWSVPDGIFHLLGSFDVFLFLLLRDPERFKILFSLSVCCCFFLWLKFVILLVFRTSHQHLNFHWICKYAAYVSFAGFLVASLLQMIWWNIRKKRQV